MKDIRRIMLATDFSEVSVKALETTKTLVKALNCQVDVVHVFDASGFEMPAPYYFMTGAEQWVDQHLENMKNKGHTALNDLLPDLGDHANGHFLEGHARKLIVKFAEENDVDMIIMGTHGHGGLNRLILGSVAEYVVRHAPCAVMTIRGDIPD